MLQLLLSHFIKTLFVTIYQCCKYFYSVAPSNFTSYKNNGNVLCKLLKILQTKIIICKELKKVRLILLSVCGKKSSRFINIKNLVDQNSIKYSEILV